MTAPKIKQFNYTLCLVFISTFLSAQNLPFVLNCDRPPQNRNQCDSINARGGLDGQNEFCENQEVIFINNTPQQADSTIYCWGDGNYSIETGKNNGKHKYSFPRDTCLKEDNGIIELEITMIVFKRCSNGYSVNRITTPVLIRLRPKIDLQIPNPVCEGIPFTIRNLSCGNDVATQITCNYVFGDGTTNNSCGSSITQRYNQLGNYPFQYTMTNRCGSRLVNQSINVIGLPKAIAKVKPDTAPTRKSFVVCLQGGGRVELNGETSLNATSHVWSSSPTVGMTWATRKDTTKPTIIFTQPGTYTFTLRVDNGCSRPSTDTLNFRVISAQSLSLNEQSDGCDPITYKPNPIIPNAIYTFNGTPFNPNTGVRAEFGQHIVVAILANECGNQERRDTFSIVQPVDVKITTDRGKTLCVGSDLTIAVNTTGGRWQGTDVNTEGVFKPRNEGRFTLTYSIGTGVCERKDTIQVLVVRAVALTLNPQSDECSAFKYLPKPIVQNAIYSLNGTVFNPTDGIQVALGTHSVLVTLENACGKQEAKDTFVVAQAEVLKINTASGQSICTGKTVTLDVSPTGGTWSGSGVTARGVFTPQTAGNYVLTYTIGSGSCLQKDAISFTVIGAVSLSLDNQTDQCLPFKFRPSPIIAGAIYTMDSVVFNHSEGVDVGVGNHTITASLKNLCDSSTISKTFKVTGLPIIDLMMSDTVTCYNGTTLTLKANASTNDGRWSGQGVGNGVFSPLKAGFGTHTLTYTAGGTGCEATKTIKVKVIGVEVKTGVNDLKICDPDRAAIVPLSGGTPAGGQYRLESPTGQVLTQINPSVLGVGAHKIYYVVVDSTSSSLACPSYAFFTVTIYGRPAGGIQGDSAKCTDTPLSIQASGGDNYEWNMDDGATKQGATITHSYTQEGRYNIRLIVTSGAGCRDTLYKSVKIDAPANAVPSPKDTVICHGSSVQYRIVSGKAESYKWLRDGEEVATGIQPLPIIFENLEQSNKTYLMTLSMGVSVCPNQSQAMTVTVRPKVKAVISASKSRVCSNEAVQFAPNLSRGHISKWTWDLGNGTTSRDSLPAKMMYQTDTVVRIVTIRLVVEDTLCAVDTTIFTLEVIPLSTKAFMNVQQTRVCQGVPMRFVNQSSRFARVTWEFGDFTPNSSDSIVFHSFKKAGTYTVTLYAYSDCGGFDTIKQLITVLAAPDLQGIEHRISDKCLQTKVRFWVRLGSPILPNLEWHLGDSAVRRADTLDYQYAKGGEYWVKAIVISSVTNCLASDSIKINIENPLTLQIDTVVADKCGLKDGAIFLKTSGGSAPYLFAINDTIRWTNKLVFDSLEGRKSYIVFIKDNKGCLDKKQVAVAGRPPLSIDVPPYFNIELGDSLDKIRAKTNFIPTKIQWQPKEKGVRSPNALETVIFPLEIQRYVIEAVDSIGCPARASTLIEVTPIKAVKVASAFSPNRDGHNDMLYVHGSKDVKIIRVFKVFNRWGNLVFENYNFKHNEPQTGWDGIVQNREQPNDVYTWFVIAEFIDGDVTKDPVKGSTQLVR